MIKKLSPFLSIIILIVLMLFTAQDTDAHVKWFTTGSYADRPLIIDEVVDNIFIWLMALCILVIAAGVWFDYKLSNSRWYLRLNSWLEVRKDYSVLVMRVAAAMLLLLSWQGDAMLAPTLKVPEHFEWIGWYLSLKPSPDPPERGRPP